MIDIWERFLPLSDLKKNHHGNICNQGCKKIIEDEISEMLNLVSVDLNEIVVFQDCQGKLKTSNISPDDILTRRDAVENSIAVFADQGRL